MGTRHVTCVIQGGDFRVAQYGQWDGYPEGQGKTILSFLAKADMNQFRDKVQQCCWLDEEKYDKRYKALGFAENGITNMDEAEIYKGAFPYLNRDLGAKILTEIYHATDTVELRDNSSFAHDSLMCEWAYVVDLDRNVLEVYSGFNKNPDMPNGVFANVPNDLDLSDRTNEYFTVALVKTYSLDNLPSIEVLVEECDPPETRWS